MHSVVAALVSLMVTPMIFQVVASVHSCKPAEALLEELTALLIWGPLTAQKNAAMACTRAACLGPPEHHLSHPLLGLLVSQRRPSIRPLVPTFWSTQPPTTQQWPTAISQRSFTATSQQRLPTAPCQLP